MRFSSKLSILKHISRPYAWYSIDFYKITPFIASLQVEPEASQISIKKYLHILVDLCIDSTISSRFLFILFTIQFAGNLTHCY